MTGRRHLRGRSTCEEGANVILMPGKEVVHGFSDCGPWNGNIGINITEKLVRNEVLGPPGPVNQKLRGWGPAI